MTHSLRLLAGALLATGLIPLLSGPAHATERWTRAFTANAGGWHAGAYPRMAADVTGDGLDDLIGFGHGQIQVTRSTGIGVLGEEFWLWNQLLQGSGWRVDQHHRTTGDMNGDGRADVVAFGDADTYVALSNGAAFDPPVPWIHDYAVAQGWTTRYHDRAVADVNGDGYDDIVGFGSGVVWVSLSGPGGAGAIQSWSTAMTAMDGYDATRHSRQLGDFNGDGLADVISFDHYGVLVMLSTGSSFGPVYRVLDDFGWEQRGDIADAPRYAADVDGDGLSDVVLFAPEGVLVARSMGIDGWGRPQVGPVTNWVRDFGSQQGWYGQHVRTLGDVNGDGRADVIGYHDDWVRVALSRDFRFDNDFTPLSGGELVTRFEQALDGRCLTASGDLPEGHTCNDARPFGWIATPRGGSTYALVQEGRCLHLGVGSNLAYTTGAGCADLTSNWFMERSPDGRVRLRNAYRGTCLELPRATDWPHQTTTHMCDASDRQLWNVPSMRPRTVATTLRFKHSGQCVTSYGWNQPLRQLPCDGRSTQSFDMFDDGQGRVRFRSHADPNLCIAISSTDRGWSVNAMYCVEGSPWEWFAIEDLGNSHRLLVSQHSGHCLDLRGSQQEAGADVLSWDCTGTTNQQVTMPGAIADVPMEISLQDVGSPEGTALVIAHRSGAYLTRDPVAIVAYLTRAGIYAEQVVVDHILTLDQQDEYEDRLAGWNWELPGDIEVKVEVLSIAAHYDIGPDGVSTGVSAAAATRTITIAGVAHTEAKVLTVDGELTVREDGFAFGPSADLISGEGGFGDPDGSYVGVAGGIGSRGFSVGASWGRDGRYGVTVPLAIVSVSVYVRHDDAITAANFANDIGAWMAFATLDAFDSAWGWSSNAYNTAAAAVSGLFNDVGSFIGDVASAARALGSIFSWF